MKEKEFNFLGYVQFYIYLEFNDKTATICSADFDFRKPITEDIVVNLAKSFMNYYKKELDKETINISFVSKEAYDAFIEKYGTDEDIIVSIK